MMRKTIFWLHLTAGVCAGLVILVMSVTGVLLTYQRQILVWADHGSGVAPPSPGAVRLPPEDLLAKVREQEKGAAPEGLTLYADPARPAAVAFARGRTVFADPYTGQVLGEGSQRARLFFRKVTEWHRYLALAGDRRATGKAVTGACNLAFLFIVVSGFYLWWPRSWRWASLKGVIIFRRGLRGKARDWNWHNVLGVWSFAPLFVVVLTATLISYPWSTNALYRLAGDTPPQPRPAAPAPTSPRPAAPERSAGAPSYAGLNTLWSRAEQQVEGWRSISLRLPASAGAPREFTLDRGDGGQPQKKAILGLHPATGEVTKWEPFAAQSRGRRWRAIGRFLHTGEALGIAGQTAAGLASAAATVLVYTGFALAWRRFTHRKRSAAEVNEGIAASERETADLPA